MVIVFGDEINDGWACINGAIFGGLSNHEYGHYLQQVELGDAAYYSTVVLPSLLVFWGKIGIAAITGEATSVAAYHSLPWEAEADRLGGLAWP